MAKICTNILPVMLIFLVWLFQPIQVVSHDEKQSSSPLSCGKPHRKHIKGHLVKEIKSQTPYASQHKNNDTNTKTNTNTNTNTKTSTNANTNTDTNTNNNTKTETNTSSNTNTNINSHTHTNSDTNTKTKTKTDTNTISNTKYTNVNVNSNSNSNRNSNSNTNTNVNSNSNSNSNTNTNTSTNTNANTNTHFNTSTSMNTNTDTNTNTNINTNTNTNANTNTNTGTSTNTHTNTNTDNTSKSNSGHGTSNRNSNSNGGEGGMENMNMGIIEEEFMKWVSLLGLLEHSHFPSARNQYAVSSTIIVDKLASPGTYPTIQAAIDSIPIVNNVRVVIQVKAGIYKERVTISPLQSYITLQGAGAGKTVIEWDTSVDNQDQGNLFSASVSVNAPYFIARNMSFRNSNSNAEGGMGGVAVRVSADTTAFIGCEFSGSGNTLYDHIGRHFYKECTVEGGVDFIFGQALSMFERCHLSAKATVARGLNLHSVKGLIDNSGMSFLNCRLTGAAVANLGKSLGSFSRVVMVNSFLDTIQVHPEFEHGLRACKHLNVFFGLHNCDGPGAEFVKKLFWCKELDIHQAKPFMSMRLIDGHEWIYQIDMPLNLDYF